VWVSGFWFGFALRRVALLCGVFVQLHLALFPAGGPFLPSLSVNLYAAGAADTAMRPAPPSFRPCNPASPHCAALVAQWVALHDAAPGLWSPELRALAAPLLAPVLLHDQREYGRHLADQRFADLLASAPPVSVGRVRRYACRWLDPDARSRPALG
jgi:hypothetical protein